MRQMLAGYTSLIREMLGLKNDGSFLSPPASFAVLIAVCASIGLLRNALSVWTDSARPLYSNDPAALWALGIRPKFYTFDPDIMWALLNFPVQLCVFPSALLHWQLNRFGHTRVEASKILGLAFYLQALHLIIPFVDWLGFRIGLPWSYTIGTYKVATAWYINFLVMTPGIILAWLLTGYMVGRVLTRQLGIPWPLAMFTFLTTFVVILLPTYFFFPTFNTLFARVFGVFTWNPNDPRIDYPILIQWGYGTYFALTALLGLGYFENRLRPHEVTSQ